VCLLPQTPLDFLPLVANSIIFTPMKKAYIKFRCSHLEKAIIEKKASHSGLSVSAYCRSVALQQKISYKLTDEELECYQNLTKYHNNFASITNLLKNKDSRFAKEVQDLTGQLKEHLNKFQ
jgi:hypothetical protein